MRAIDWADGRGRIIDQTCLTAKESFISLTSVDELAEAVSSLRVRVAPALGVAGVLEVDGTRVAPEDTRAYNPAFDVTPADLVTAIVTAVGTIRPGEDDLRAPVESARKTPGDGSSAGLLP